MDPTMQPTVKPSNAPTIIFGHIGIASMLVLGPGSAAVNA
jgi:hypothetical protein